MFESRGGQCRCGTATCSRPSSSCGGRSAAAAAAAAAATAVTGAPSDGTAKPDVAAVSARAASAALWSSVNFGAGNRPHISRYSCSAAEMYGHCAAGRKALHAALWPDDQAAF